jgi:hypothetical protein
MAQGVDPEFKPQYHKTSTTKDTLKLFQELGKGDKRRALEGVNSSIIYFIYCKNLCKCYNVPPPSITVKK